VRLQVDEQQHAGYGHRVRPRENGHSAELGFHRTPDVDRGPTEGDGPVVGVPSAARRRSDGRRIGGRDGGHVAGRNRMAVAQDQTRRERDQGHKTHADVLRRRTRSANGRVDGTQNIRASLGRTRQPGRFGATLQTQELQIISKRFTRLPYRSMLFPLTTPPLHTTCVFT